MDFNDLGVEIACCNAVDRDWRDAVLAPGSNSAASVLCLLPPMASAGSHGSNFGLLVKSMYVKAVRFLSFAAFVSAVSAC